MILRAQTKRDSDKGHHPLPSLLNEALTKGKQADILPGDIVYSITVEVFGQ